MSLSELESLWISYTSKAKGYETTNYTLHLIYKQMAEDIEQEIKKRKEQDGND